MEIQGMTAEAEQETKRKLTCDEEAWILDRLEMLCNVVSSLKNTKAVSADRGMLDAAVKGAIHGAAEEIAHLHGVEPSYINYQYRRYPPPIANPLAKNAFWKEGSEIMKTIMYQQQLRVPMVPNYIMIETKRGGPVVIGESPKISIADLTEQQLRAIGAAWTDDLINQAEKIKRARGI